MAELCFLKWPKLAKKVSKTKPAYASSSVKTTEDKESYGEAMKGIIMKRKKGLRLVLGRSGGNAHQRRIRRRHFVRQENLEAERERLEKARQARIMIPDVLVDDIIESEEMDEVYRRQMEKKLLLKALPKRRSIFSRFFSFFF